MCPLPIGARHNGRVARRRRRRGEGSVYRSQGSWIACYSLGSVGGKRITKRKRCRSEREALLELEQMRREYGRSANPSTATVGQWLEEWQRSHKRGLRGSTTVNYATNVRLHIDPFIGGPFGLFDLDQFFADMIDDAVRPFTGAESRVAPSHLPQQMRVQV